MKAYKKGDWVVFPNFNEYPVQLEQDGAFGIFDTTLAGTYFFKVSKEEAKECDRFYLFAVRDPRAGILEREGWSHEGQFRRATKKDIKLLVNLAKKDKKRAEEELKIYCKISDKL